MVYFFIFFPVPFWYVRSSKISDSGMVMWRDRYLEFIDSQCAIDVSTGRIHIIYEI